MTLRPCPWAESRGCKPDSPFVTLLQPGFEVTCSNCGASGPSSLSGEAAALAWNGYGAVSMPLPAAPDACERKAAHAPRDRAALIDSLHAVSALLVRYCPKLVSDIAVREIEDVIAALEAADAQPSAP